MQVVKLAGYQALTRRQVDLITQAACAEVGRYRVALQVPPSPVPPGGVQGHSVRRSNFTTDRLPITPSPCCSERDFAGSVISASPRR